MSGGSRMSANKRKTAGIGRGRESCQGTGVMPQASGLNVHVEPSSRPLLDLIDDLNLC